MTRISFEDTPEKKSGEHRDFETNKAAADRLIKEHEGKLPDGMSVTVDHFRMMFSFQTQTVAQIATPVSLHQDMMSFLPEMRYQMAFYKKGAEYAAKQALERAERVLESTIASRGEWI
jgi:hypothetical protein